MGLSGLFTVAGVAVAIYAVIPKWRRLSIRFRIGPFVGISLLILTILLVHYYQFIRPLETLGFSLSTHLFPSPFTAGELTYITIGVASLALLIKLWLPVYFPHRIHSLRDLFDELRGAEIYSGLLSVLERNGHFLLRVLTRDYPLWRLRSYVTFPAVIVAGMQNDHWTRKWWIPRWSHRPIGKLVQKLPTGDRHVSAALAILRQTLLNRSVVRQLVAKRPYLILQILRWRFRQQDEFLNLYFQASLKQQDSILYHELMESMTMESGYHRFSIPESNRLLYFLFSDIDTAIDLGIWKPIGDNVNRFLDRLYRREDDPYNLSYDPEFDDERARTELYLGLLFFQVMVPEAIYQGASHHMWLMYFEPFTKKMVRNHNLSSDPLVDRDAEWPVRYNYLLYEIITSLENWILTPLQDDRLDPQADHLHVSPDALRHAGNVPSASIRTIGRCTRHIVEADSITYQFKKYILKIVFGLYFRILAEENGNGYGVSLRKAIASGGHVLLDPSQTYRDVLLETLHSLRYEKPHWGQEDVEALRQAIT